MALRANMQARNSSGKQVSLLNDDCSPSGSKLAFQNPYESQIETARSNTNVSGISSASSPRTPALLRSDSYDSQATNGPESPITPIFPEYSRQSTSTSPGFFKTAPQFEVRTYEYPPPYPTAYTHQRPNFSSRRTSSYAESSYEEDSSHTGIKRYPCRYRDMHHCEKTFTTSGHASRHSKIHTAEKAVHCTYPSCQKKFTRADNMKQHLETHYKSKTSTGGIQKSSSAKSSVTNPSAVRKSTATGRSGRPPTRNLGLGREELSPSDPALSAGYEQIHERSPRPAHVSLDIANVQSALMSKPMVARTEGSAGLDVLANVAALQS